MPIVKREEGPAHRLLSLVHEPVVLHFYIHGVAEFSGAYCHKPEFVHDLWIMRPKSREISFGDVYVLPKQERLVLLQAFAFQAGHMPKRYTTKLVRLIGKMLSRWQSFALGLGDRREDGSVIQGLIIPSRIAFRTSIAMLFTSHFFPISAR